MENPLKLLSLLLIVMMTMTMMMMMIAMVGAGEAHSSVKRKSGSRIQWRGTAEDNPNTDVSTSVQVTFEPGRLQGRNKVRPATPATIQQSQPSSSSSSTPPSSSSSSQTLFSSSSRPNKRQKTERPLAKVKGQKKRVQPKSPSWWGVWSDPSSINRRLGQGHLNRNRKVLKCNNNTQIYCPNKCLPLVDVCDGFSDCQDKRDERNCEEMEVKLVGGSREGEGRVEIIINNITGTICSLGWNDRAARVVCRMFGYKNLSHVKAVTNSRFGKGTGVIWLSQVTCSGSETDLNDCHSPVWGDHTCTHDQDAGVVCQPRPNLIKNERQNRGNQKQEPTCGRRPIPQSNSKILGGKTAVYGALPWQARVLKIVGTDAFHQCGGTIVDRRWIVTAAHCIEELQTANIRVSVGDYETTKTDPREQLFRVEKVVVHPDYQSVGQNSSREKWWSLFQRLNFKSSDEFINDIALLKVRSNEGRFIEFNAYVQPACLPTAATPYRPGLKCEISGWGLISNEPMRIPDRLQYGIVPIMSTYDCERSYKGLILSQLPTQMFCAGFAHGSVDTCQGDSGGPLVCNIHGTHTLMGVTSWGFECGKRHSPGIYTKVGVVVDWINSVVKGKS